MLPGTPPLASACSLILLILSFGQSDGLPVRDGIQRALLKAQVLWF
jgi:hypothetical protein